LKHQEYSAVGPRHSGFKAVLSGYAVELSSELFRLPSVYLDPTRMRLFRALLMPACVLYAPRTRSDAVPCVRFLQTLSPHLASWKRSTQGTSMEAVSKAFG
jgi:hypothetical protein